MMTILVGTVFSNDSPLQRKWYNLQYASLTTTTDDFDHVVVVSEGGAEYFSQRSEVLVSKHPEYKFGQAHQTGLEMLRDYFLDHKEYDYYLILDSDAFPVREHWLELLLDKMGDCQVALPIRSENLETRLHASVLFAKKEALEHLTFEWGHVGQDLAGNDECDIHVPHYQHVARNLAFPLMRSNVFNIHPMISGVYYDCFYHHSCGSRNLIMRGKNYWDHLFLLPLEHCTNELFRDPFAYIETLRHGNQIRD